VTDRTILVEGASATTYLRATMTMYARSLEALKDRVEDGQGVSQLAARMDEFCSKGQAKFVFVVWDQDVLSRPGNVPPERLINHRHSFTFSRDFEAVFPEWMFADALASFDPDAGYPGEAEIHNNCPAAGRSQQPYYERLQEFIEAQALLFPSKVKLAELLAEVAIRTWYQPEGIRRLMSDLIAWIAVIGDSGDFDRLIPNPVHMRGFNLNSILIESWQLRGRLALSLHHDLWLVDLDSSTAEKIVEHVVAGPPCWSPDGLQIVFPSPTTKVRNSEAIRVYDLATASLGTEILRIGNYLCWGKDGLIYGNSLQDHGYQVHAVDPTGKRTRRVLQLSSDSGAPIMACVDRKKDRILIGEQGRGKRVASIYSIFGGQRVWDGLSANLSLAEYSAGAFSPDGLKISWPVEEPSGIGESSSLWVTDIAKGESVRLTPPEGRAQNSTWSPDGKHIAFMWSRWGRDPTRMWVVDVDTRRIEPLIEGLFPDDSSGMTSVGCHSWSPTSD